MLSVLYCFVHIYWAKNGSEAFLEQIIEEIKKYTQDDNNIEEEVKQKIADIRATLSMDQDADIYSHVMGVLANPKDKKRFDLYQLDKTPLFTKESMEFIKVRMNRLASVYAKIGDSNVFFGSKEENQHVVDYLISENTYEQKQYSMPQPLISVKSTTTIANGCAARAICCLTRKSALIIFHRYVQV